MKKLSLLVAPAAYLASAAPAFAATVIQACPPGDSPFNKLCNITQGRFGNIVSSVITILFIAAVIIALGFLVWGGIKWILSGGDKSAVEGARNTIVAAIVGLVIVFLSYFILSLVTNFFLGVSFTDFTLPTL